MNLTETEAKYLAGLIDADGNLSFDIPFNKGGKATIHLRMTLWASESIDREGYIPSLPHKLGLGRTGHRYFKTHPTWSPQHSFIVGSRSDLEIFLPRIIKHLQIKGKQWQRKLEIMRASQGKSFSKDEIATLKSIKYDAGPIKPKNHPSWAWTAGYLDGDGCYQNRYFVNQGYHRIAVTVEGCAEAASALALLHKAYKGNRHVNNRGHLIWHRSLGVRNASFAFKFLAKMAKHSKLKKHKIESLIHSLRQRLSERNPTG